MNWVNIYSKAVLCFFFILINWQALFALFSFFFFLLPHQICKNFFIKALSGKLNHISGLFCPLVAGLVNIPMQAFWWRLSYTVKLLRVLMTKLWASFHVSSLPYINRKFTFLLINVWVYLFMRVCLLSHISRVQLFAALQTVVGQAPMSMGFSRREHWSGCPALLQGIFPTLKRQTLVSCVSCIGRRVLYH